MGPGPIDPGAPEAFQSLLDQYRQYAGLESARGVLGWDEEVTMPPGGARARSQQHAALAGVSQDFLTDDVVADWLDSLDEATLTAEQGAVVREIRRKHDRAVAVSPDLTERFAATRSEARSRWEQAREADDFGVFAPIFEDLVSLRREYASQIAPDQNPYAVLFAEYEPYLSLDTVDRVLDRLREELVPLIDAIAATDHTVATPFTGRTYEPESQEALHRAVLDMLGFDWEHGRLDTATHPSTSANQFDARITTMFPEDDPLTGLLATVHEFGHAAYYRGLPDDAFLTPLGETRNQTVGEAMARFWENHVGRSQAFWERAMPLVGKHLDGLDNSTAEEAYRAATAVDRSNLIRPEADELTYHLHIVLRYDIERKLLAGDLDVSEVPAVWNNKMEQYLGVRPGTVAEGCLQDIHWGLGVFGYFPNFSLGTVLAAQIDHRLRADLGDVDGIIRDGEFAPVREWLTEHIHRHGCRYETPALIRKATGEALTSEYFLDYATEKYGQLYDL